MRSEYYKMLQRLTPWLVYGACAALPLKLSVAYAFMIPLVLVFVVSAIFSRNDNARIRLFSFPNVELAFIPLCLFIVAALVQSAFGLDFWRSVIKLLELLFVAYLIPAIASASIDNRVSISKMLFLLVSSQALASAYSVLEGAFPHQIGRIFIGPVSESGQLSMVIFVALGLCASLIQPSGDERITTPMGILGLLTFCSALIAGFSSQQGPLQGLTWPALIVFGLLIVVNLFHLTQLKIERRKLAAIAGLILPLLFAALLINLKRGPWLGVAAGLIFFLWVNKRWVIVPVIAAGLVLLIGVEPIHSRLAHSEDHFYIAGGRNVIWNIGVDLAVRYPLGLGFENSGVLRSFSEQIPEELKHFHNNPLNILVETGCLGLTLYAWWIFCVLKLGFGQLKKSVPTLGNPITHQLLAQALACGILAWQLAGLVEYNFGDSEVALVAFFLVGAIWALASKPDQSHSSKIS